MSAADWTKDRVALLKQAVADGKTSGQAAVILGFERGAIVGKARRLGLRFGTAPNSPAQSKGLVRFHAARRRADRGEMRARVIELYRGGASMRAVARLVDRTHERVRQILLEENIPVRGRGGWTISPNPLDRRKTRTPIKRVDDLLRSGLGVTEIVAQTGLSADHVSHRATLMRMESRRAFTPDSSCPKFAHHEEFCALVTAEGGMPTAVITPSGTMWIDMAGQPWRHQACGNTALKPGRSRMGERHLSELGMAGLGGRGDPHARRASPARPRLAGAGADRAASRHVRRASARDDPPRPLSRRDTSEQARAGDRLLAPRGAMRPRPSSAQRRFGLRDTLSARSRPASFRKR
jgi:hypothetical protein